MQKFSISAEDILPMAEYAKVRAERRKALVAIKRPRRIDIGPVATAYFESYETVLHQIHEMLAIEKGGVEQIPDELAAYNPLVPKGAELVATVMFEIDDPIRRKNFLSRLGGVEETMFFELDGEKIYGKPEEDVDRTTADGKASSVQFIHFPFTAAQIAKFRAPGQRVIVGFEHPQYAHLTIVQEASRQSLAGDFA